MKKSVSIEYSFDDIEMDESILSNMIIPPPNKKNIHKIEVVKLPKKTIKNAKRKHEFKRTELF